MGPQKRNGEEAGKIRKADAAGHPYTHTFRDLTSSSLTVLTCYTLGQRLAEQKGQSDDLVGAMQAAANAGNDPASDDDDNDDDDGL